MVKDGVLSEFYIILSRSTHGLDGSIVLLERQREIHRIIEILYYTSILRVSMSTEREAILEFVRGYHDDNGEIPSIAQICRGVEKMYREKFYSLFPGKLAEVCRSSGLPIPAERIEKTKSATQQREAPAEPVKTDSLNVTLNDELSKMALSAAYLSEVDVSIKLHELFEMDKKLRNRGISLETLDSVLGAASILRLEDKQTIRGALDLVSACYAVRTTPKKFIEDCRNSRNAYHWFAKFYLRDEITFPELIKNLGLIYQ